MNQLRERLRTIEQKHKLFKQQQFIFISALERSRDHARDRTEPVSSVAQVQRYMSHHCSNATDRRIFSLFLGILSDLREAFTQLESTASAHHHSSEALDTCRKLFSSNCNISQLQAHFPHDEVNRLSCNEARNYYGGVVSVIPLALDLLKVVSLDLTRAAYHDPAAPAAPGAPAAPDGSPLQTEGSNAGNTSADQSRKTTYTSPQSAKVGSTGAGGWHAGKPAWRPPGRRRF